MLKFIVQLYLAPNKTQAYSINITIAIKNGDPYYRTAPESDLSMLRANRIRKDAVAAEVARKTRRRQHYEYGAYSWHKPRDHSNVRALSG